MPSNRRLLELALIGLETERERINNELAEVRAQLAGAESEEKSPRPRLIRMSPPRRRRRIFTAAQRRAASERMKKYWAARRRQAA